MQAMIILGKRRHRYRFLFFPLFIFLFSLGFLLGFFYLPAKKTSDFSPVLLLKSQCFYSGSFADLHGVSESLPPLYEGEQESVVWDVAYADDTVSKEKIPVFVSTATTATADLIRVPQEPLALTALMGDSPKVLIYCTHTSESYDGGGTVLDVAHALKNDLETDYGIGTVVSDTVHDSPEWYKSYANSRQTAAQLLADYGDAALLIDLHRDSGKKKSATTLTINGKNAAKILLVVGSNMTMKHPNWEENLKTAKALGDCIKAENSDLLSDVRVQKGRYNQHLTPKAVLLEFGTDLNTLEEATVSADLVAAAIARYLQL